MAQQFSCLERISPLERENAYLKEELRKAKADAALRTDADRSNRAARTSAGWHPPIDGAEIMRTAKAAWHHPWAAIA